MSSHICLRVHFVWSTLHRNPTIETDWLPRPFAYFGSVLAERNGVLLAAGGMPDHIHLYASLPATTSIADVANALKANSSRWIKDTFGCPDFAWQSGYGAFSVSPSMDQRVRDYIRNQPEHHRTRSFMEEYVAFLDQHGVVYDQRYVFV